MMYEEYIVNYLLDQSDELKYTYELYQDLLSSIKNKNIERFNGIIQDVNQLYPKISLYMKKSIKSLKLYKDYVNNSLITDYTNGVLEGINNKIKVIKRIAFGYRSYYHFKARILITHSMAGLKKGLSNYA